MKTLDYQPSVTKGSEHRLTIDGESITTTRQKEVLVFGKARIDSRRVWKMFKEAVRLGDTLQVAGGQEQ